MIWFFKQSKENLIKVFFAVSACSWMPHWSCHYYKIETNSSFIVGPIEYNNTGSLISMIIYSVLILLNIASVISEKYRIPSSGVTGLFHLLIAALHIYRFYKPFPFVVFGFSWSLSASLTEAIIVGIWGLLAAFIFRLLVKERLQHIKKEIRL